MSFMLAALLALFTACGSTLSVPTGVSVDIDNRLSWSAVSKASNYEIDIRTVDGSELITTSATGENVNSFSFNSRKTTVDLSNSSKFKLAEGDYIIKIKALGKTQGSSDSEWSEEYLFHKDYETGCTYALINNGTEYEVNKVNNASGYVVIEDVYRGKPVTRIATAAFKGSSKITGIELGSNIVSIGQNAFYGCSKLETVKLSEGLVSIGDSAFKACMSLHEIEIPSTVKTIAYGAFMRCKQMTTVKFNEGLESIGDYAFSDCLALTSVNIPDTVTTMGEYAFSTGDALVEVTVGAGIETIEQYTFSHCAILNKVTFKENSSLTYVEDYAFSDCPELETIAFPDGLQSIGKKCFENCSKLEKVTFPDSVTHIGAYAFDATALYESSGDIVYAGNWIVAYKSLTKDIQVLDESNIKEGTYGIADQTFISCPYLTTVALPSYVKIVGRNAFQDCHSLMTLYTTAVETINYAAFANCVNLTTLRLGEGLTEIGKYAFLNCSSLDNNRLNPTATLPDSVRKIGADAFYNTAMYNTADGVVFAGKWVVGCNVLPDFQYVFGQLPELGVTEANLYVDDEPCVGIADYAFCYQINLATLTGLENIMYIGKGAFYYCQSLASVSLSEDLLEIPDYAFARCESLFKITLPARVKSIGQSAFFDCKKLNEIDMPNTVSYIGKNVFNACYNLAEIKLSNKLTEIPDFAFFNCVNLTKIVIPDSVEKIGRKAFGVCALKEIEFGSGVKEIDYAAFYGDALLQSLTIPDNIEVIGNHAFYKCYGLQLIDLGNGVKSIGDYAFSKVWSVKSLVIPESVEEIGEYAFANMFALTSVNIRSTATNIGANAFYADAEATVYTDCEIDNVGWNKMWNSSTRPVVYGCEMSEEGYVESLTITENTFRNVYVIKIAEKASDEADDTAGNGNTEENGEVESLEETATETELLYHQISNIKAPARAGYKFVGWATEKNSSEVAYDAVSVVEAPVGITLYAIWEQESGEIEPEPGETDTSEDENHADDGESQESGVSYENDALRDLYDEQSGLPSRFVKF